MGTATPNGAGCDGEMPRSEDTGRFGESWLRAKLRAYPPGARHGQVRALRKAVLTGHSAEGADPIFANPFTLADLDAFDEEALREMLAAGAHGLAPKELARALHGADATLARRVLAAAPIALRRRVKQDLRRPASEDEVAEARKRLLDGLFWELTYWKTPDLYEALTEGERLHPRLFPRLAGDLRGKTVLDAGAGSGRATLECLRQGARRVYAMEPSPGLLRILERKLMAEEVAGRLTPLRGRFDAIPLPDDSVDTAISCSAFTADPEQGGERGLAELRRVTRTGGLIAILWPRPEDYGWLAERGFNYVALPAPPGMGVSFRSLGVALEMARRFYAGNRAVLRYLLRTGRPEVPFAVLGTHPPHDYAWLRVGEGEGGA